MQEKLVIFLQTNRNPCWAYLDADGRIKDTTYEGDPSLLAEAAANRSVLVLVPAEDVLLTSIVLPKMNRARLLQAVPYALEEQLIAEVEETHVALGERNDQGEIPVAAVSHEKMREWLSTLANWGVKADSLIPADLALDGDEYHWHAGVLNQALVKTGKHAAFGCDINNFTSLLELAVQNTSIKPQSIRIANASAFLFATALQQLPVTIEEEQVTPPQLLTELAFNAAQLQFNLLQGPYAVKKKTQLPAMRKIWKVTAYLGAAWVALLFLYPLVSYFILSHRVNAIDEQIAVIYKKHFPESRSVIAPRIRVEEKLNKLNAQIGANKAFALLAAIGSGMSATPSIVLKRLDFQNNQMSLELTAANSDDFSVFADYLTQQGLTVKQQNADLNGAHVNATLVIE